MVCQERHFLQAYLLVLTPPPPILRLNIAYFAVAEGWLLLDIGWFVLFSLRTCKVLQFEIGLFPTSACRWSFKIPLKLYFTFQLFFSVGVGAFFSYDWVRFLPFSLSVGKSCLSFWYNMNGANIGSLEVEFRKISGAVTQLFSKSTQETQWRKTQFPIESDESFQVIVYYKESYFTFSLKSNDLLFYFARPTL